MTILERIDKPSDLNALSLDELEALSGELREEIIDVVNRNGGHLAGPLGVVELTVALHRVFDPPIDQVIWDVGHQCYAHKLLTGRRTRFATLRQQHGISGYPEISESVYDSFGTGHSATSISAALGMAAARDRLGEDYHVVAVIGDGAMTGGMALEGLLHAGHLGLNMLVILNDNKMSIAPSVGSLANAFNRMIMAQPYKRAKEDVGSFVKRLIGDGMVRTIQDLEKSVKGFITKGALFQEFGFNYIGPVDGHDLPLLVECLSNLKAMKGPVFLHCRTEKGKGLKEAEEDPAKYHGVTPRFVEGAREKLDAVQRKDEEGDAMPAKGETQEHAPIARNFTDAFATAVVEAGRRDERVAAITAAMPSGTGLSRFEAAHPERYFDVGICEQHAVTFAAGLARKGMRPVVAVYSTFLQRGYDQLVHDVAIQNLPVVFAIDRAGLVGEDSPTHSGAFDLSFLRPIPNVTLCAPRDGLDMALMLHWALEQDGPTVLRYARSKAPTLGAAEGRDVSRGEILREGSDLVFLGVGPCLGACLDAAELLAQEGLSVGVADARFVKPLDTELIDRLCGRPILSVEENVVRGGFGSAVMEYLADTDRLRHTRIHCLGLPDQHAIQATREQQLAHYGLDVNGLVQSARQFLRAEVPEMVK